MALSVLSPMAGAAEIKYGLGELTQTRSLTVPANKPTETELTGLKADQEYIYQLRMADGDTLSGRFHTARAVGQSFTFGVQGDSHPERVGKMFSAELYARTLQDVAASKPDFYVMMGDDFSLDRFLNTPQLTPENVNGVYQHQRSFVSAVGQVAPLFLVNGNHEQASATFLKDNPSAAVLAGNARNAYFPLPAPDHFYTGDATPVNGVGLLRDYYAWTWGDALFMVIDPYWHSGVTVDDNGGGKANPWGITLGDEQYRWMSETLLGSKAKFKFVFAHHVQGTGRGGVELADFHEWGGRERSGQNTFAQNRPGWALPIHQLMVKAGVSVFFQGHDHLFARQEKDGVIYQSVPNPADDTYTAFNREAYRSGDLLPNSGHLRVTVTPKEAKVEYVRSYLPADEKNGQKQGEVAFAYSVPARNP